MGWINLKKNRNITPKVEFQFEEDLKATTENIENVSLNEYSHPQKYPFVSPKVSGSQLPFIPATEVRKGTSSEVGGLLIVIDEVVYDCTEFATEHPGGEGIVEGFAGSECSWQFWRFHGKKEMEVGWILRVGRTKGVMNKYAEPMKWVGLKTLGDNDW
ncbi:uncharacterized protein EAE97_000508 [Botrytis byssoidea]|uniref:Cytochrome b5 heme-binding domain-containing protein n=1 Tax=Botrytis byssoidea TaxID=139641 RepID=A0A9P5IVH8_9HELO|nr:uncharacterized protein EAE97_000508 [Botrytis byssoidea]KAF7955249.1 hypothetical protein EAE97_000508 [Botrytis byssoidea]